MSRGPRLVLASASPARHRLLRAAGLNPEVIVSAVDEEALSPRFETPAAVAQGLADAKARDVADRLSGEPPTLVLGCDSVLEVPEVPELAGQALGKPADAAEAATRWRAMGGHTGLLHTGHCLIQLRGADRRVFQEIGSTAVAFDRPSEAEIAAYIATGEPLSVAGAFTIDGLGGAFVRRVDGDPANVVGLSLPLLRDLVGRAGVFWPDLWQTG